MSHSLIPTMKGETVPDSLPATPKSPPFTKNNGKHLETLVVLSHFNEANS